MRSFILRYIREPFGNRWGRRLSLVVSALMVLDALMVVFDYWQPSRWLTVVTFLLIALLFYSWSQPK